MVVPGSTPGQDPASGSLLTRATSFRADLGVASNRGGTSGDPAAQYRAHFRGLACGKPATLGQDYEAARE